MKAAILCFLLGTATADLRQASQPKKGYKLLQQGGGRGSENFVVGTGSLANGQVDTATKGKVLYMEPSTFGYGGLKNQRAKNYDNFLRSNIDNEQDNRNFNNEAGKDHLPFRTFDSAVNPVYPHKGTKAGDDDDSLTVNNLTPLKTVLTVAPGEPRTLPLRWNNPHAAELEVNLWIMCSDPPTVVPIKKPTCSGEGNQNNAIQFAIPNDFNDMNWASCASTACFKGCIDDDDCVLQVYAHSVETRQYSTSVPIKVTGQKQTGLLSTYNAKPLDDNEATNYVWPTNYDLVSMVQGEKAKNPTGETANTGGATKASGLGDVRICVSHDREGIDKFGQKSAEVELKSATAETLNAGTVNVYLCKGNAQQIAGEQLVDKVVFTVSANGAQVGARTENYAPYEMKNEFETGGVKTIKAVLTSYGGQTETITVQLTYQAKRWRFRRHLQTACPLGVQNLAEPQSDPWLDLSKLKRETCMSAQDPNSNYPTTTVQRAVLHSDVANHAYQNSNYSPYSGQQHGEISRTMQAAAVIHMVSSNRGELGKNNIPQAAKNKAKQLNKQVNKVYKAYEKVANKVIDAITNKANGKNGAGITLGPQPLGNSFRAAEKGATSTKRLKTTTYVPSFNVAGYDTATIQNVVNQNAKYKTLLTTKNAATNQQYIQIYPAAMKQLLPEIAAAAALGITYMESVKMIPCKLLSADLQAKSKYTGTGKFAGTSTPCCEGSMQNTNPGGCGNTLTDVTNFQKKNAAGNRNDGGQYAASKFITQRYSALYGCPEQCLTSKIKTAALVPGVIKTAQGSCIDYMDGASGCTKTKAQGSTDCTPCAGIYNNVAPSSFSTNFGITNPTAPKTDNLFKMIQRIHSAPPAEDVGNVLEAQGGALVVDNTAVCYNPSSFECPGNEDAYQAAVEAGTCKEEPPVKIDRMCDDGPCDNVDDDDVGCQTAKSTCKVDPESGVLCMPGSENDPCAECEIGEYKVAHAEIATVSALALVLLASTLL